MSDNKVKHEVEHDIGGWVLLAIIVVLWWVSDDFHMWLNRVHPEQPKSESGAR